MDDLNPSQDVQPPDSLAVQPQPPVWGDLEDRIFQEILGFSRTLQYGKDEEVLLGGSESHSLYYVQSGVVEVSHTIHDTKIVVALIGAGNFFGEIGFFDRRTRVRDIRVTEESVLRVFDHETLAYLQQKNPGLHGQFLSLLARSICDKFRRILEEREPLTAYAASLSTGKRSFEESRPIPSHFFRTSEWQFISRLVEDFKAHIFDLSYQLQQSSGPDVPEALERRCYEIMDQFNGRIQNSEAQIGSSDVTGYAWGYVFKEVFPYCMRSRFAERAYFKPKGYAGDFVMMEMIYRNRGEGDGKLGLLLDNWFLNAVPARAVRGRRKLLAQLLESLCHERRGASTPISIMNLACGSNRELFDFLACYDHSERIAALCMDADLEALEYTNRNVNTFPHKASVRLMNDNVIKWCLGRVRHGFELQDIIYSAGLTDYLDDRLFNALIARCYENLKPGGVLVVGNFGPNNSGRVFMDHILQWKLIHRNEEELRRLFAKSPFGNRIEIAAEEQGVNLFAVARRPALDCQGPVE